MITSNLALRFVLELAALASVGYAGAQGFDGPDKWLAALGGPLALATFWAVVVAPKAVNPIPAEVRVVIGSVALLGAAAALALSGQLWPAVGFALLVVANHVVLAIRPAATGGPGVAQ